MIGETIFYCNDEILKIIVNAFIEPVLIEEKIDFVKKLKLGEMISTYDIKYGKPTFNIDQHDLSICLSSNRKYIFFLP